MNTIQHTEGSHLDTIFRALMSFHSLPYCALIIFSALKAAAGEAIIHSFIILAGAPGMQASMPVLPASARPG